MPPNSFFLAEDAEIEQLVTSCCQADVRRSVADDVAPSQALLTLLALRLLRYDV
jgi:hypothetical protein